MKMKEKEISETYADHAKKAMDLSEKIVEFIDEHEPNIVITSFSMILAWIADESRKENQTFDQSLDQILKYFKKSVPQWNKMGFEYDSM